MSEFLVVGSGLTGATVARCLAERGRKVKVLEKRDHIGGNIYDYVASDGQIIQLYGPHIFHTNSERVFNFINSYSKWNEFKLRCAASWDGHLVETPFDFKTIDAFYNPVHAASLKKELSVEFPSQEASVLNLLTHESTLIKEYGEFLFNKTTGLIPLNNGEYLLTKLIKKFLIE